jgi:molybdate transport system regulatory protein
MMGPKIDALLALRSEGRFLIGRERIKLLEAVARLGSISKAAKVMGFSYKTAWDAVNSINNLLPSPAFVTKAGGRGGGGGAEVTPEGLRLIATFHRLEERLSHISSVIAQEGLDGQDDLLLFALGLSFSTRNVFQCEVAQVEKGLVDVSVTLTAPPDKTIVAIVTNEAAAELALAPGRKALALIKAPFVDVASTKTARPQPNRFFGVVERRVDSRDKSEIAINIGAARMMTSVIPLSAADELNLGPGSEVAASFDAADVILVAG